jgi:hypothetical protein
MRWGCGWGRRMGLGGWGGDGISGQEGDSEVYGCGFLDVR